MANVMIYLEAGQDPIEIYYDKESGVYEATVKFSVNDDGCVTHSHAELKQTVSTVATTFAAGDTDEEEDDEQ